MKITFYGRLADTFGRELELDVERPCTVAAVRARIAAAFPAAADQLREKRVRACVANKIVADNHLVMAADDIDFLAPVSGG